MAEQMPPNEMGHERDESPEAIARQVREKERIERENRRYNRSWRRLSRFAKRVVKPS